jgi:Flp pilus assembly protein CpaB
MQDIFASRLFSSRRGTALLGLAAAVLAGVVLLVYLNSYRSSVRSSSEPITVLVARNLIEKGTSGNEVASKQLYQASEIAKDEIKPGAFTDSSALRDTVAATDIYPGQQLTSTDFTAQAVDSIPVTLEGNERAISLNLDETHGITGPLHAGDHVDVWAGGGENANAAVNATPMRLLIADATVLSAPTTPTGGGGANVVLQVNWWEVPRVASSFDGGKIWLILRPQSGAKPTRPPSLKTAPLYLSTKGG